MKFPKLQDIENVRFVTYQDASYAKLENGGSQGAHVIFLVDDNGNAAPISWQSKRIRRVVKSTLQQDSRTSGGSRDTLLAVKHTF